MSQCQKSANRLIGPSLLVIKKKILNIGGTENQWEKCNYLDASKKLLTKAYSGRGSDRGGSKSSGFDAAVNKHILAFQIVLICLPVFWSATIFLRGLLEQLDSVTAAYLNIIQSCGCWLSKAAHQQILGGHFKLLIESNVFVWSFFSVNQAHSDS